MRLEDAVGSLVRFVGRGYSGNVGIDMHNWITRPIAIVELAETIAEVDAEFDLNAEVKYYENPYEGDEEHKTEMESDRFTGVASGQHCELEVGIRNVLCTLAEDEDGAPLTRTGLYPAC